MVEVRYSDGVKTAGLVVLLILVVLGVVVGISFATVEIGGGPSIQDFDGTRYVLNGKALKGSFPAAFLSTAKAGHDSFVALSR